MKTFKGRVIIKGQGKFKALVSHTGFNTLASYKNCKKGKNICTDQNNKELYGKSTVSVALCIPETIGSTTGGMVLYNAAFTSCAPGALLFSKTIDSLAASGAILADVWTEHSMPTIDRLGEDFLNSVKDGDTVEILEDGTVNIYD